MTANTKIFIIDGKSSIQAHLKDFLSSRFQVEWAVANSKALSRIAELKPNVILSDIVFPDIDGLVFLREVIQKCPDTKIIVVTEFQNSDFIIKAFELGVHDYIRKEINPEKLEEIIKRASKIAVLENRFSDPQFGNSSLGEGNIIVGQSEAICKVFKIIGNISNSRAAVAIGGETGTGKELVARTIHENSPCKDEPFITVDCSSIVETLAESFLYGHQKGAFTGAIETHKGKLEIAGNGTIFFDEVSELPLSIQGKLLRFLQEKEFEMVGGKSRQKSNARIITASNKNLSPLIKQGKFRKDLYYRIRVVTIRLPPLRDRKEDIPLLINHFRNKITRIYGVPLPRIEEAALQSLREYPWPGNVRELENILIHLAIMARGELILKETVEEALESSRWGDHGEQQSPVYPSLEEVEKDAIYKTLKYTLWNITSAAKILKISRPTLREKIAKYNLSL